MNNIEQIMKYFNVDEVKAKKIQDAGINLDQIQNKFINEIKDEFTGLKKKLEVDVRTIENEI
jgi:hypothetical protein